MSRAMATLAAAYVGRRVELAPHRDEWMQGDRYGTVLRVTARGFTVRLNRSGRTIRAVRDDDIGAYLD